MIRLQSMHGNIVLALLISLAGVGCAAVPVRTPGVAGSATAEVVPIPDDAPRLLPVQGALNVRGFVGLRGRHGLIPAASFVRAADLSHLTAADRDTLAARGVALDVDLRTAEEAGSAPDALAADERFRYLRVSLLGQERIDLGNLPDSLGMLYVKALSENRAEFRQVFEAMAAQREGAVLFHCTAGKDRTGMISAVLLSLAGVPRADIVHNYAVSAHYLKPMLEGNPQLAERVRVNPKLLAMMGTPPDAIEAFLDAMEKSYGGARAYLKTIGVSDAAVRSLLVRLGQAG